MVDEDDDFREVAHCGGKITFRTKTDNNRNISYSISFSSTSHKPLRIFAVYALPQGIACGNIQIGGVGQSFNPPPFADCISVFIGSDSHGMYGHTCPDCDNYWRSSGAPAIWHMTCPYCGVRGDTWQFLTAAQKNYVAHYAQKLSEILDEASQVEGKECDFVIDMDEASDESIISKPDFYYSGQTQQTKFKCNCCGGFNDIKGKFGYCSICGTRNNLALLDSELSSLRERLNDDQVTPSEALQSAVSQFDSCCRNYVSELVDKVPLTDKRKVILSRMLFHNVGKAFGEIEKIFDIDLLKGINSSDIKFLKMMFCRRHSFEHDGGIVTDKYIQESGDDTQEVGILIRENQLNVHRLIGLLNRITRNFHEGFLELYPAVEEAIKID